jgi:hypothetical protein
VPLKVCGTETAGAFARGLGRGLAERFDVAKTARNMPSIKRSEARMTRAVTCGEDLFFIDTFRLDRGKEVQSE